MQRKTFWEQTVSDIHTTIVNSKNIHAAAYDLQIDPKFLNKKLKAFFYIDYKTGEAHELSYKFLKQLDRRKLKKQFDLNKPFPSENPKNTKKKAQAKVQPAPTIEILDENSSYMLFNLITRFKSVSSKYIFASINEIDLIASIPSSIKSELGIKIINKKEGVLQIDIKKFIANFNKYTSLIKGLKLTIKELELLQKLFNYHIIQNNGFIPVSFQIYFSLNTLHPDVMKELGISFFCENDLFFIKLNKDLYSQNIKKYLPITENIDANDISNCSQITSYTQEEAHINSGSILQQYTPNSNTQNTDPDLFDVNSSINWSLLDPELLKRLQSIYAEFSATSQVTNEVNNDSTISQLSSPEEKHPHFSQIEVMTFFNSRNTITKYSVWDNNNHHNNVNDPHTLQSRPQRLKFN